MVIVYKTPIPWIRISRIDFQIWLSEIKRIGDVVHSQLRHGVPLKGTGLHCFQVSDTYKTIFNLQLGLGKPTGLGWMTYITMEISAGNMTGRHPASLVGAGMNQMEIYLRTVSLGESTGGMIYRAPAKDSLYANSDSCYHFLNTPINVSGYGTFLSNNAVGNNTYLHKSI